MGALQLQGSSRAGGCIRVRAACPGAHPEWGLSMCRRCFPRSQAALGSWLLALGPSATWAGGAGHALVPLGKVSLAWLRVLTQPCWEAQGSAGSSSPLSSPFSGGRAPATERGGEAPDITVSQTRNRRWPSRVASPSVTSSALPGDRR